MSLEGSDQGVEQAVNQPQLCVRNCGFFSNVGSNGMCSKCFREAQAELQKASKAQEELRAATAPPAEPQPAVVQPSAAAAASPEPEPAAPSAAEAAAASTPDSATKTSTRCQTCRKKVGLTGFKCRCGQLFCGTHRYAEAHDCSFDYKTMQREKLAAANPVVQAAKVERI